MGVFRHVGHDEPVPSCLERRFNLYDTYGQAPLRLHEGNLRNDYLADIYLYRYMMPLSLYLLCPVLSIEMHPDITQRCRLMVRL